LPEAWITPVLVQCVRTGRWPWIHYARRLTKRRQPVTDGHPCLPETSESLRGGSEVSLSIEILKHYTIGSLIDLA